MRNEDNDCIRYLMKEMDPSEELLMERAMMEDENLLIEVESMRQTLKKLDKLPRKIPPSELTDRILEQAADKAREKRNSRRSFNPVYKYAVAATLALTITAGGTWFFMDRGEGTEESPSPASSEAARLSTGNAAFSWNDGNNNIFENTAAGDQEIDPWVDRENILRVEDYNISGNVDFNALLERSNQKLKLIENSVINQRPVKSIQLTGSEN